MTDTMIETTKVGWDYTLSHTVALTDTWIKAQPVGSLKLDDLPNVIKTIYSALRDAGGPIVQPAPAKEPLTARQIRDSITDDYLVSFEDGKNYKMLKRHLAGLDLSPAQYRAKWGLPSDYPMTAPGYSKRRSALAKANGLGTK